MTESKAKKKVFDGRYDILSIVGRGACSVVYRAQHISPPVSDVALKVLVNKKGEKANADRLRKEALAMVSSRHRYVIRLEDFHSVGDLCYLSMEYAPEGDLRKFCSRNNGTLDITKAERFLLQATEALGFIHRAGIIHRDIKPENILVMNDTEIRLGDFGVAVLPGEESSIEELQRGIGTMDYMAPEVLEGIRYDQRSDVYALGVTFYELISGQHPFAGVAMADQLTMRQSEMIPHLSTLAPKAPGYLSEVIMRAMSYSVEDRYPTGREMLQAILVGKSEAPITTTAAAKKPSVAPKQLPKNADIAPTGVRIETASNLSKPERVAANGPAVQNPQGNAAKSSSKRTPLAPLTPKEEPTQTASAGKTIKVAPKPAPVAAPRPQDIEAIADSDRSERTKAPTKPVFSKTDPEHTDVGPQTEVQPDIDFADRPSSALPGIGLKIGQKSPQIPKPSGGGVRLKESTQRETVSVPPAEVSAAREVSPSRQTVTTPSEANRIGGLAAAAIMGAPDDSNHRPTIGYAGPAAEEEEDNLELESEESTDPLPGPKKRGEVIQGFQGKFKKVREPSKKAAASSSDLGGNLLHRLAERFQIDPQKIKRLIVAAVGVGILLVVLASLSKAPVGSRSASGKGASEVVSNPADAAELPVVKGENLTFPHLPQGMYIGTLSDLIPGHQTPLTIISLPNQSSLAFIVGVAGWTPQLTSLPPQPADPEAPVPAIRVASNGIILEITGQVVDGTLTGFFRNLTTGEEGQWNAAAVRGES